MKVSTITRTVTVSGATLLNLFAGAVYGDARSATGKNRTFYVALGSLVGITAEEAVKKANRDLAKVHRITVIEFRKWLPTVFSEFAREILEADK